MKIENPLSRIHTRGEASDYIKEGMEDGLPIDVLVFRSGTYPGMLCELRDWEDTNNLGYPWHVGGPHGPFITQASNPTDMWYVIPVAAFDNPLKTLHKDDNTEEWERLVVAYWGSGYHPSTEPTKRRLHKIRSDSKWFLSTMSEMLVSLGQAWDPNGNEYIYPVEFPTTGDPQDAAGQLSRIFLGGR